MKILFCNKYNFPFSGTEVFLFELMGMLRERGHKTALFTMGREAGAALDNQSYLMPPVDFKNCKGLLAKARLAVHALYSREARQRLRQLIADFQPDIAHVRNVYHHLSPSIFWELKAQGIRVIYHLNDFKLLCPSYNFVSGGEVCERCRGGEFWHVITQGCYHGGRSRAVVLAAEAYFHKWLHTYEQCVDCFLVPSEFVRDKLVESGWDANKIQVIYHFQTLPEQAPPAPIHDGPILYFGRLSAEKGVADLVRAMERVPKIRLRIAGDGPQKAELQELVRNLALRKVEFVGHLQSEELKCCIAASRFTVLPSRAYETLGKSILESYAMGRAVVASDLGSRRDWSSKVKPACCFGLGTLSNWLGQSLSCMKVRHCRRKWELRGANSCTSGTPLRHIMNRYCSCIRIS